MLSQKEHVHAIDYTGNLFLAGKKYRVLFDTGSAELIVPSALCETPNCKKHPRYGYSASEILKFNASGFIQGDEQEFLNVTHFLARGDHSRRGASRGSRQKRNAIAGQRTSNADYNYQPGHNTDHFSTQQSLVRLSYAEGSVSGNLVSDQICFDDKSALCVPDVHFLAVSNETAVLPADSHRWGAVLGLALPQIAFGDKESFLLRWWDAVRGEKNTRHEHHHGGSSSSPLPLFSLYLGPDSVSAPALLEFGRLPRMKRIMGRDSTATPGTSRLAEADSITAWTSPLNSPSMTNDNESVEDLSIGQLLDCANEKAAQSSFLSVPTTSSPAQEASTTQHQHQSQSSPVRGPLWVPVTQPGYWQIHFAALTVNGESLGLDCSCANCCEAAVDSGSSVILASQKVVDLLRTKLGFEEDCTGKTFPDFGFVLNGTVGRGGVEVQPRRNSIAADRTEKSGLVCLGAGTS